MLVNMVPPDTKRQSTVWRMRTEWTLDTLIRSQLKSPLDKQVDVFDKIEDSLFDSWTEEEDEDSGLNLRVLSLVRRMAALESLFGTTAGYNWVIADNPSNHAVRQQLCYDVVIAPPTEQ